MVVEMAKLHDLSMCKYLECLLENRPSAEMSNEELDKLAPWNEDVHKAYCKCENFDKK